MVRDGYFYAAPLVAAAVLLGWLTNPAWAIIPCLLAFFFLWFFRDPERAIPQDPGAVVSPGDGAVTDVSPVTVGDEKLTRLSIFLSVFNVHVNRSPIAGKIASVEYRPGKFYAAMRKRASEQNEMNVITVATPRGNIVFKQIAGAIARRVLCWKGVGDRVGLGERVGMIRFGSRVDLWLPKDAEILVRRGQKVAGGSSILAKWKSTV